LFALAIVFLNASVASNFQNGLTFPSGIKPSGVSAGDFNKDGNLDLVVANTGGNSIAVLLGNGNGNFQPPVKYKIGGQYPLSIAVGDFNSDGNLDLVVGMNPNLAILLGNGDGTFQPASVIANYGINFIAAADFNGDGKLDLVYCGEAAVRLGNGDGTFQGPISLNLTSACSGLTIADFNGDGKLDLAVTESGNPGYVVVALGQGNGSFRLPVQYSVGNYPVSVAAADFNGDGKIDLAVVEPTGGTALTGAIALLLGNGDGTFQSANIFAAITDAESRWITTADFNGDGKADIAVVNSYSNDITELLGNGDGTFQRGMDWSVGTTPLFVLVGDFNKDGLPDLATANYGSNDVTVLLGHAGGAFSGARDILVGKTTTFQFGTLFGATGDFNEDGNVDLVATNPGALSVVLGKNDGSFTPPVRYAVQDPSFGPDVVVADLNHDSHLDLIAVNQNVNGNGSISVLLGKGDGTFQPAVNYSVGVASVSVSVGDFNGDGNLDLIVADRGGILPGDAELLLGNGDGTFQPAKIAGNFSSAWGVVGDFNGDGKLDFAGVTALGITVILGNGDGTFQAPIMSSSIGEAVFAAAADLNGDGKLDLVTANGLSNTVSVALGNGDGTFQTPTTYNPGANPTGVAVADFNGDGKLDIAVADGGSGGGTGAFTILRGKGDGTFTITPSQSIGCNPVSVALTDFNGDGKPDLAVFNVQSTEATILLNTSH
jgi:hypothetical protein